MRKAAHGPRGEWIAGLAFIAPNLVGVLVFVIFPVAFSLAMAFSDWDLKLHNRFSEATPQFVGLENFIDLFADGRFLRYLGNTLFFMMGIPVSIAGSLIVALLLNREPGSMNARRRTGLIAGAGLVFGCAILTIAGLGGTAMTLLMVGLVGGVVISGLAGGTTVYRTIFYTPHFVAGVATFILWKKLYDPQIGPINTALRPILDGISRLVASVPAGWFSVFMGLQLLAAIGAAVWLWATLRRGFLDGETGGAAAAFSAGLPLIPITVLVGFVDWGSWRWAALIALVLLVLREATLLFTSKERFFTRPAEGFGSAVMLSAGVTTAMFILIGLASVVGSLPAWVAGVATDDAAGLAPPDWLTRYAWSKPALMIMGFWAAIGSNNMLLYLAALSGVPPQLYEAADIDGAGWFARFWHVTWPQLAPTTFFIVVMATIYGLQGGFEMARTMTDGGPAGATTTLSYFIYTEGFETGRLGFASAVAWALFALVFVITLINWTFGNRYVND
ncbi:MAG: sugar ABC transporter permease [Planctomycetota bacterium]